MVAGVIVTQHKALYKEPARNVALTDPSLFGVNFISGLRISHLSVEENLAHSSVSSQLVKKAIQYVEDELLNRELAKAPDQKGGFKDMVTNSENKLDRPMADHYLAKKYFWFLYSQTEELFGQIGFKSCPLEGYKVPSAYFQSETVSLVKKLLDTDSTHEVGKSLRLLDTNNNTDMDMVRLVLQEIELETFSQLNKSTFHLELSGGIRSSLSLTKVENILTAAKLGSYNELNAISEKIAATEISDSQTAASGRRKSSVIQVGASRFSLLPELSTIENGYEYEELQATGTTNKYISICGAVLTNNLQRKTFFILWRILNKCQFQIIGIGELKIDVFGAFGPVGGSGSSELFARRRGSSFTGLNDMGGSNFQDLDILISTAVYVANTKSYTGKDNPVYVLVNDLPITYSTPLLHDFFTSYMPQRLPDELKDSEEGKVEYISDFKKYSLVPMLKNYGSHSPNSPVDWIRNSMIHW